MSIADPIGLLFPTMPKPRPMFSSLPANPAPQAVGIPQPTYIPVQINKEPGFLRATSAVNLTHATELAQSFLLGESLILEEPHPSLITALEGAHLPGPSLLMRTSGTTSGHGSLVVLERKAVLASADATAQVLGEGVWVTCLPTNHIAGFATLIRSLRAGFTPLDGATGSPHVLVRAAYEAELRYPSAPRYLSLVPTQLHRLLASALPASQFSSTVSSPERDTVSPPDILKAARSFTAILVGGAACPPALLAQAREAGLNVRTTYGMTETSGGCVYDGLPLPGAKISLDNCGRISIAGPMLAWGYLNAPFGSCLTTKDVGRLDNGVLTVLGRADEAITCGGMTIHPSIVEHAAASIGIYGILLGIPDPEWGELSVFIYDDSAVDQSSCTQHAHNLSPTQIHTHLAQKLERPLLPRLIIPLSALGLTEFPRTRTGKLNRRTLREHVRVFCSRVPPT